MKKNQPPSKEKRVNQIDDLDFDTPVGGSGIIQSNLNKSKKEDLMDGNHSEEEEQDQR